MADYDVEIRFGADTSALNSGVVTAKASILGLQDQLNALDGTVRSASAAIDDDAAALRILAVSGVTTRAEIAGADAVVAEFGAHAAEAGAHGHAAGAGTAFWTRELRALGDELSSGRYRQADGTFLNLAVHAVQAGGAWAAANPALLALGAAATAAAAAVGYLIYEAVQANSAMNALELAAVIAQYQLTADQASALRDTIEQLANVGAADAADIAKPFIELGKGGELIATQLAPYLPDLARNMGQKVPEAAKELAKNFTDLTTKGRALVAANLGVNASARFDAFVQAGQRGEAYLMVIEALTQGLGSFEEAQQRVTAAMGDTVAAANALGGAFGGIVPAVEGAGTATDALNAKLAATNKALAESRLRLQDVRNTPQQVSSQGEAAAKPYGGGQLTELDEHIAAIKRDLATLPTTAAAGVSADFKGASEAVAQLSQRLDGLATKKLAAEMEGNTGAVAKLDAQIKVASEDLANAKLTLADAKPAAIIGPDEAEHANQLRIALSNAVAKRQELLATQRGGTELQKLEADQAAQNAARQGDALEQASARLAVAQKQLEIDTQAGASLTRLAADSKAITEATKAQTDARNADAAAANKVAAASAKSLGDAKTIYDAEAAKIALLRSETADRGKQAELDAQAIEAQTAYNAAVRQMALTTDQEIIDDQKATTKQREADLDELLKTHQITSATWLQGTIAALDAEQDKFQDVADAEIRLAGTTAEERLRIERTLGSEIDQIADQEKQAQVKAAEEATKAWDSGMKTINSAFDSQIKGLLTGTETWAKALKNVLTSLAEDVIKLGLNRLLEGGENVARNALGIGQVAAPGASAAIGQVTASASPGIGTFAGGFGAAPTFAGAAGGATKDVALTANTGALATLNSLIATLIPALGGVVPASLANTVAQEANTVTTAADVSVTGVSAGSTLANTISTDANTIATNFQAAMAAIGHIFGFAAGTPMVRQTGLAVIHAGEAIIPAHVNPFASMDVGHWGLPSDMLVQGHAGEMVVPAAQTPWMQSLAANAAAQGGGASGSGGGDVHNHFHGPVMDWGGIARGVSKHLKANPSMTPRYR